MPQRSLMGPVPRGPTRTHADPGGPTRRNFTLEQRTRRQSRERLEDAPPKIKMNFGKGEVGKFSALLTITRAKQWRTLRLTHLRKFPYCVMCAQQRRLRFGNTVDHVVPHRGDLRLMLDPNNLQTLCASHHSASKAREEYHGHSIACDVSGAPSDPRHPWNNQAARLLG